MYLSSRKFDDFIQDGLWMYSWSDRLTTNGKATDTQAKHERKNKSLEG